MQTTTQASAETREEIHIRITKRLKAQLVAIADTRDCSLAQLVRDVLREFANKTS